MSTNYKGRYHEPKTTNQRNCDHIVKLNLTHPIRVGVSGITASGKQHLQTN